MRSILIALIAALCALPASTAEQQQAPKDMVLLTVSGTIGESNRGALDPKNDSLLTSQKADFKKAFAFDRAMLLGLEQGAVTATTAELGAPATFKGPLLREVLGRIEAAKMKITFVAVDGFTGWLSPEDVDRSDWILALEADGVPLGIGQQGPLWLITASGQQLFFLESQGVRDGMEGIQVTWQVTGGAIALGLATLNWCHHPTPNA